MGLITPFTGCKKEEQKETIIERGTVNDIQGNTYNTVKIGNQWWMAENLRTTTFNDSTPILYIERTDGADEIWTQNTVPAYTYINDSISGLLYHSSVIANSKNIAPIGWHVATDEDWKKLEATIGMTADDIQQTGWRGQEEADLITAKYNIGWPANDQDNGLYGLDKYGFDALPSGCRGIDGRTNIQNNTAFWWADTQSGAEHYYRYIDLQSKKIFRQLIHSNYGMSIRCVKD
ncbi:MAG: fibrobacter succinogenes major paralogous domain-containing protein [Flavobacteriales bacterium]|nr:fibrobacter succinogenes major paralogous domain-containing protein [Flavobacteriales bacterium]